MLLQRSILVYLLLCVKLIQALPNPVFWERSFLVNITSGNMTGNLVQSTSNMATSQDFQGIHVDPDSQFPPKVINQADSFS
jgi:hypothetical protein